MNKAIQKFIDFLERRKQTLEKNFVFKVKAQGGYSITEFNDFTNKIAECENIGRQLKVPEKDWPLHGEVFVDFDILSDLLSISGLNRREAVTIIFTFLKKNMEAGICLEKSNAFDQSKIATYPFKAITPEEVSEMIYHDTYRLLLSKSKEERTEHENQIVQEIEEFTEKNPSDVQRYKTIHQKIASHYFDKLDTFTEEDIPFVVEELKKMGLSEAYSIAIQEQLTIEIQRRNRKPSVFQIQPLEKTKVETKPEVPKPTLTKKESNTLYREIKKYYNPETHTPLMYLELPTIIYCLTRMHKLAFPEETIYKFLRNVEKENRKQKRNPITMYVELYNKLKYYEEKLDIGEQLNYIESILQEMFITTDAEYAEWKKLLEEELSNCLAKISSNYEYELEESLKLKK